MIVVLGSTTSAALLVGSTAVSGLGIATGVLASRALGPTGRGDLAIITYWPALIAVVLELGITETVTLRTAGANRVTVRRCVGAGLVISLACSIVGLVVGFRLLPHILRAEQMTLLLRARWYLLFIPASLVAGTMQGALLGLHKFRTAAVVRVFTSLAYLVTSGVLWHLGRLTAEGLAGLNVLFAALPGILAIPVLGHMRTGAPTINWGELYKHLNMGCRLQGSRLASLLAGGEDRAIANLTLSSADIGCYQIPGALTNFMPIVPQALSQLMFARLGKRAESDRGNLLLSTYVRTLLLSVTMVVLILPLLPFVIPVLYGRAFTPAVVPAMIIAIASVFGSSSAVLQLGAKAAMRIKSCIASEIAAIITMAAAAIPLTAVGGIAGLALAYLVGRVVSFLWMYAVCDRVVGICRRDLWPWSANFRDQVRRDVALIIATSNGTHAVMREA